MAADPRRIKELFVAALELPNPQDRHAFLERECGADAELRQRLDALLKAHENPASILDRPLAAVGPVDLEAMNQQAPENEPVTTFHRGPAEEVGSLIAGRYKLLEQIGEGGMGTVWVAEQTQPVRRKVALKLIKAGMDSKNVLSRFEAERQALALMDHPNIAKVLDGGTTDSGRPFFVMEYVKGVPFTRYCDDARLSIAQRLALFVPVCQAVQHAHQKGIIHRDLKPSNILICLYDGKAVPKVIDFGLAKAMHQPLTEHTLYTGHGVMMGTPLYMSPEQAELNNLDVDTRTDIYALGVILYELLTGTTPLEKARFKEAAWHEMLRVIKEEEPPRPSARLSGSGSLPSVAAQRQLEPVKLTKLVRGELDWIVMKCLEKDRSRRYDTANGLARDVERYLADEVVEARPPSAGYRLRKMVRKHRTALAMVTTMVLLLVAGGAVSTWQAMRAIRAESQMAQALERAIQSEQEARLLQAKAQTEEQKARKSAAEANTMIAFFKELMLEARVSVKEGDKWRAKTVDEAIAILDSEKIRTHFADHPLAEANIREWAATFGWLGGNITAYFAGLKKGGQFTISGFGEQPPVTFLYDPDRTCRYLERALELRSVHLGPDDPATLETAQLLGNHQFPGNRKIHLLSDLVSRCNSLFDPDDDRTLQYKESLALAYEQAKKLNDAIVVRKDVYLLTKNKRGADDNVTLNRSDHLAADLFEQKEYTDAESLLLASFEGMHKALGVTDAERQSRLIKNAERLVRLYEAVNKKDKADAWRRKLQEAKDAAKTPAKP